MKPPCAMPYMILTMMYTILASLSDHHPEFHNSQTMADTSEEKKIYDFPINRYREFRVI